jgi:hypothetical protein
MDLLVLAILRCFWLVLADCGVFGISRNKKSEKKSKEN